MLLLNEERDGQAVRDGRSKAEKFDMDEPMGGTFPLWRTTPLSLRLKIEQRRSLY